jgi:hypothetical protein
VLEQSHGGSVWLQRLATCRWVAQRELQQRETDHLQAAARAVLVDWPDEYFVPDLVGLYSLMNIY